MSTTTADLYREKPDFLEGKSIDQIIAMSGDGKLRDDSDTSNQLRELLSYVPSESLNDHTDKCLSKSFTDSGLALQDIVNEVGKRLGFKVTNGRYRGKRGENGFDGLWQGEDGRTLIVEVKTTDAYRIKLDTISDYREQLDHAGDVSLTDSAILIVVGREDTGELEAQIRGSKQSWDMRLISIDSLHRLLKIKEELEDQNLLKRIHATLFPQEYTKVDGIVDLVFATAEDIVPSEEPSEEELDNGAAIGKPRKPPLIIANFHEACIAKVEDAKGVKLIKESRTLYGSPTRSLAVLCAVSKFYEKKNIYWYSIHPPQIERLKAAEESYFVFGCKGKEGNHTYLIPSDVIISRLDELNQSSLKDRDPYWHIYIFIKPKWVIRTRPDFEDIELASYKL
ncbi:MAG TPA: hypothetical protein EYQ50_26555 [Verrucomicrobiales bacterium]|nr:hypothetical protein [Verrucomicrobiales bacterium]